MSTLTSSTATTSKPEGYSGGQSKTAYESGSFQKSARQINPLVERWVCSRHDQDGGVGYWVVPVRASNVFNGTYLDFRHMHEDRLSSSNSGLIYSLRVDIPQLPIDLVADIGWATKALEFADKPTHTDLVAVVNGISKLIASRKTSVLGAALNMLVRDPRLRLDVMMSALRGSFPARSQITQWSELIAVARKRIVGMNRNPESLLRGLT